MKEKQKLAGGVIKRYRAACKKEKSVILAEFVKNTGYNKKYASHILSNFGKICRTVTGGKPVEAMANAGTRKSGGRKKKYGDDVFAVIRRIWEFFDYRCGKLLAPLIRLMTDFLAADPAFGITGEIKSKLMRDKRHAASTKKKRKHRTFGSWKAPMLMTNSSGSFQKKRLP